MNWFVKYLIPVLAIALFALAVKHVVSTGSTDTTTPRPPSSPPPSNPYPLAVAGAGIIEAQTENISVGSPVAGIVLDVAVHVGEQVESGAELFRIDARQLEARELVLKAGVEAAKAELLRLQSLPRPEELPLKDAMVTQAQARLAQAESNWKRTEGLVEQRATTSEQVDRAKEAVLVAAADVAHATADLELLRAGTWKFELAKAEAAVQQAEAELQNQQVEIQRHCIHALVAGEVLQVNVRPGEFVGTPPGQALIVLGNTKKLHVRVNIDENDIPRFRSGTPGIAQLRGDSRQKFPLTFKRVEPYVVPKRSLTGDNTERIDTRVLQVIYEIGEHAAPLFVGQQVDVFLEAPEEETSEKAPTDSGLAGR